MRKPPNTRRHHLGFLIATDRNTGNFDLVGDGGAFDQSPLLLNRHPEAEQSARRHVSGFPGAEVEPAPSPGKLGFPSAAWRHYAQDVGWPGGPGRQAPLPRTASAESISTSRTIPDPPTQIHPGAPPLWDGVTFLVNLTNGLAQKPPPEQGIITHAPAPPYWDPQGGYNNAYTTIWRKAGHQITWFNNQFYNNPGYDAPASVKISKYNNIADVTGAQQQLLGALCYRCRRQR